MGLPLGKVSIPTCRWSTRTPSIFDVGGASPPVETHENLGLVPNVCNMLGELRERTNEVYPSQSGANFARLLRIFVWTDPKQVAT